MKQNGGDIIGVGSYGCVFKPPLKCKNKTRKKKGVSKLMIQENGLDEILLVQQLLTKIETIPKYKKYFILSPNFCVPDKLSTKDEMQLQRKCDEAIINDYKKNRSLISHNQPYGGKNLHAILKDKSNATELQKQTLLVNVTKKLKALLLHGIIPMHKIRVYHSDIKPQNLVWSKKTIKLIDWGLATLGIPENHYNVLHFNRPYESILLGLDDGANNRKTKLYIEKELKKYKEQLTNEPIKNDQLLFFLQSVDESNTNAMSKYILMIANEFTKAGKFDKQLFLSNYYEKQDYWGLIYFYIDALRLLKIDSYELKMKMLGLCNIMVSSGNVKSDDIVEKLSGIEIL